MINDKPDNIYNSFSGNKLSIRKLLNNKKRYFYLWLLLKSVMDRDF